jgi:hypothetical protein
MLQHRFVVFGYVQVFLRTCPTATQFSARRLSAYLTDDVLYHPRVQLVQPHRNLALSCPLTARIFRS